MIQHAISKTSLENLISKDTHLSHCTVILIKSTLQFCNVFDGADLKIESQVLKASLKSEPMDKLINRKPGLCLFDIKFSKLGVENI